MSADSRAPSEWGREATGDSLGTASGGSVKMFSIDSLVISDGIGGEDGDTRGPASLVTVSLGTGGAKGWVKQG